MEVGEEGHEAEGHEAEGLEIHAIPEDKVDVAAAEEIQEIHEILETQASISRGNPSLCWRYQIDDAAYAQEQLARILVQSSGRVRRDGHNKATVQQLLLQRPK
ncbi:hypothetical protein PVAR5_3229 [Paecilomyces variotii No. 5]|uniref:Uncharacterized protein n=1 Tax=Byssochlamys spectabilis (strain No. 5 / NBRC 109023) TaxID=1356009 RepID=V5FXX1_BYSSN|nr:hypothetical protein PVAR5_3229 [Paecilomyces variotii No. 5]